MMHALIDRGSEESCQYIQALKTQPFSRAKIAPMALCTILVG